MTAIRKTTLQVAYFQSFTNLTTDLCTSNDRFGFNVYLIKFVYLPRSLSGRLAEPVENCFSI